MGDKDLADFVHFDAYRHQIQHLCSNRQDGSHKLVTRQLCFPAPELILWIWPAVLLPVGQGRKSVAEAALFCAPAPGLLPPSWFP